MKRWIEVDFAPIKEEVERSSVDGAHRVEWMKPCVSCPQRSR